MKSLVRPFSQQAPGKFGDRVKPVTDDRGLPPTPAYVVSNAILFLRRNLVAIGVTAVLVALAAFGAALLVFNKYSATAMIVVDPRATKTTQAGGVLANIGPDNTAIESLALIAKSDGFLGALVDKLDLVHNSAFAGIGAAGAANRAATVENLGARLNVARRGATYVIEATATSVSAEDSAKVANAAAQMIIDDQRGLRTGASENTAASIKSRLSDAGERVKRAEAAAAELKARLKVTGAGQGATLLERRVFELNQQLVLASAKTGEARARVDQLRLAGTKAGQDVAPALQSSVLNALRLEYVRLTRQSADQATVLGSRHPEVTSLNAQLNDMRRQITAETTRMITAAQTEFLEAGQREAALARQLKDTQTESGDLGSQLVKLGELEREAKAEGAVYEQMLTRQKELDETRTLEPNDIRIVSMALAPAKTTPGKTPLLVGASLLGLLAGLALALARETMRRTLRTTRQAERVFGTEVGSLVPVLDAAAGPVPGEQQQPDITHWLADLCSALALDRDRSGGVILVTSARRGEGRSTVAANIAASLADADESVLLVEADCTLPLNKRRRFGLFDALARGADVQRAFVDQETERYTLLPFGGRSAGKTRSANAVMSSMKLRAALQLCRRKFDFVVIDGPPVLEAGNAGFLARQADQIVFVVEWDATSRANVSEALEGLGAGQTTLVLNKVDVRRYRLFEPAQSYRLAAKPEDVSRAA